MKKTLLRGLAVHACVLAVVAAYTPSVAQAAGQAPKCSTAKLIVPWKAGGGTQVIFAIFEKVVQQMNVESKIKLVMIPGQGGNKGAKEAAKSKPDGCTLFAIHQSAVTSYLN
ncbi:MAG: tripartite tricarboxylate transporter substrate binding protein, partial [Alphaproteobacteria bacterium]|nr:tripartite tricarboxylate transporter substrate binding protein [Alphaproteobacteria bacterium]